MLQTFLTAVRRCLKQGVLVHHYFILHTQASFKKIHKVHSPLTFSQPEDCEVGTRCVFTSLVAVFYEWCVLNYSESGTLRALLILVLHAPLTETLSH